MAPRQAEILHSTQLLREGNATRGTRPMLPGRAALVRPSPINSSALPHGDKLIIEEILLDSPFNPGSNNVSRARIRSKESPPGSQSCLLHSGARVSSGEKDRRASPPSRGRGSLRHLAFHTRFRSTRALYGPAREREPLQAMAELKPEERSLTNIDRKMGYRKTTDAGSTAQRLDVSRGIIQLGRPHSFRNRAVDAHLRR